MDADAITLQEVEELVVARRGSVAFPPALETRYERETGPRRARFLVSTTLRTALIYNLFIICEYLLAPDTFLLATALHLLVVTPWMLFVAHILPSVASAKWREGLAASITIAMVAQVLGIYTLTSSEYAARYVYFAPIIYLCVASIQRMPVAWGVRLAAAVFVMITTANFVRGETPPPIAVVNAMWLELNEDRMVIEKADAEAANDA